MLSRPFEVLRAFLASATFNREPMAGMYRPMVRGFLIVVIAYYLGAGVLLMPFLEHLPVSLVMVPLRISVSLVAIAAFVLTRGTESMPRLEAAIVVVGVHMVANYAANQLTEFNSETLFTFELILLLLAAVSPSLRVFAITSAATVGAWLWVTHVQSPGAIRLVVSMTVPSVVAGGTIWGLLNHALGRARHALTVAEQRGDELERFAYICSHDMHEPVRMMNTYAGLLAETVDDGVSGDSRRYVGYIRDNALRMQTMIRDILAFSRIGREAIVVEPVDCQALVAEVLGAFDKEIQASRATVQYAGLPRIEASQTLLRMVFHNLIGNAVKFQDGSHDPEIAISAEAKDGLWRFSVRDNGIGIDPAFRDQVFVLFKRLNRKEDYPGTGIGLSACRKFLRLCGGDIDFESQPGAGATFVFTLPQ